MGDENPIRTLGDYSKPSHEGYRNTIKLPVGNNVVPLRSNTIRENRERTRLHLFQFFLRDQASNWRERLHAGSISTWEDLTTQFLAQFFPPRRTVKLHNDILMFQQHHGESQSEAWTRFKDLLKKVPHHGLDLWLKVEIFYDHVNFTTRESIDYAADEFMEFFSEVALRLKERIKEGESKPRKIEKITKYPDTKVLENSTKHNFSKNLEKKMFPTPASHLCAMSKRARSTRGRASSSFKQWKKRNSSPTRVLISHSLTPSTLTLSPEHNGLTFSKSTSLFSASLLVNSLPHLSSMPPLVDMTLYTRASSLGWEEWKGKCTFLSLDVELVYTPRGSLERLQHLVV
ncbi:zinc finger, CCHC-type containing protein [Tanacetum coccineum]